MVGANKIQTHKMDTHKRTTTRMKSNRRKDDDHQREDHHPPCLPITETILGITEEELVKLDENERRELLPPHHSGCFMNSKNGKLFSYGFFETCTVESLTAQVLELLPSVDDKKQNSTRKGPVNLTTRSGVDIGALQGNLATADKAMVQVASNFNCLENPRRGTLLHSGRFVDKAYMDCTQGPAAVFGTTSAYLYRCHFYGGGQSLGHPTIDLLRYTSEYFGKPQNGKITLIGNENLLDTTEDIDQVVNKICIGLHRDCPVMFGRTTTNLVFNGPTSAELEEYEKRAPWTYPLVDHVFSASINTRDFGIRSEDMMDHHMVNLMRALLRAAYEGLYLAAILRKRKKLYLTLIGGGSFANPIALIVDELQRAHDKWANHPASELEECVLLVFSLYDEQAVSAALAK
jgi:hypothetical protein